MTDITDIWRKVVKHAGKLINMQILGKKYWEYIDKQKFAKFHEISRKTADFMESRSFFGPLRGHEIATNQLRQNPAYDET